MITNFELSFNPTFDINKSHFVVNMLYVFFLWEFSICEPVHRCIIWCVRSPVLCCAFLFPGVSYAVCVRLCYVVCSCAPVYYTVCCVRPPLLWPPVDCRQSWGRQLRTMILDCNLPALQWRSHFNMTSHTCSTWLACHLNMTHYTCSTWPTTHAKHDSLDISTWPRHPCSTWLARHINMTRSTCQHDSLDMSTWLATHLNMTRHT